MGYLLVKPTVTDCFRYWALHSYYIFRHTGGACGVPGAGPVSPDDRRALLDTLKTSWLDASGNVLGVLGICREISPSPAARKEVLAANDQF